MCYQSESKETKLKMTSEPQRKDLIWDDPRGIGYAMLQDVKNTPFLKVKTKKHETKNRQNSEARRAARTSDKH